MKFLCCLAVLFVVTPAFSLDGMQDCPLCDAIEGDFKIKVSCDNSVSIDRCVDLAKILRSILEHPIVKYESLREIIFTNYRFFHLDTGRGLIHMEGNMSRDQIANYLLIAAMTEDTATLLAKRTGKERITCQGYGGKRQRDGDFAMSQMLDCNSVMTTLLSNKAPDYLSAPSWLSKLVNGLAESSYYLGYDASTESITKLALADGYALTGTNPPSVTILHEKYGLDPTDTYIYRVVSSDHDMDIKQVY